MKKLFLSSALITMLLFNNSASAQNTFPSSGNVGIGTLSPSGLLDVRGDAFINGVRVGTGPANDTTSVVLGRSAFSNIAPGGWGTVAIGMHSLYSASGYLAGYANVAVGYRTLYYNTTGYNNTAIGVEALYGNISGEGNIAIGRDASRGNISGDGNSAIGYRAMPNLISGSNNTAVGIASMGAVSTGNNNVAIGILALYGLGGVGTNSANNVAIGNRALLANLTGNNNIAAGAFALDSNTVGSLNTASGYYVMHSNKTGQQNVAAGAYGLYKNSSGHFNTGIGTGALYNNFSGIGNVAMGYYAGPNSGTFSNAVAIGYAAATTASAQVRLGNNAITSIGGYVSWTNISDGRIKINVQENVPGLDFINQLKPVTYNLDLDAAEKLTATNWKGIDKEALQELKKEKSAKEKLTYTGFIAQDVEKAAQASNFDFSGVDVPKNNKDLYGLRYAEFVVPLVKAVQELTEQNKLLEKRLEQLETLLKKDGNESNNQSITATGTRLEQNVPNPLKGSTSISYTLPKSYSNASIVISDMAGQVIKTVQLSGSGKGSVQVNTTGLAAGNYSYTLYVNGNREQTRTMQVSK